MSGKNMQQVWDAEQEILDVFHRVCIENGLCYSLAYGTLLGAVRHQGFIPWDDDVDLAMPREDYEKFLKIWNTVAPKGYLLQNTRTDEDFTQNFTKIRKDHTTFLEDEEERRKNHHKGIFIDIFPFDRVAPGEISRTLQYIASAINLLYSRGFTSGSGGIIGIVERILIRAPHSWQLKCRRITEKYMARWNKNKTGSYFCADTIRDAKVHYPGDSFDHMTTLKFCGKEYQCVGNWDAFLRVEYGDYTQLPPEEERVWTHHPIIIDFERNYEELMGQK